MQSSMLERFLTERHLTRPDGRELFRYRTTDDEFSEMERLLQLALVNLHPVRCAEHPVLAQWFVLWGSEWWRREYNGLNYSWKSLFDRLQRREDVWTREQRAQCVKLGIAGWGRPERAPNPLHQVALEGGLPLGLLSIGSYGVITLLKMVVRRVAGEQSGIQGIRYWVEQRLGLLPQAYQQECIITSLTELVLSILQMGGNHNIPGWRDYLPFPLDDAPTQKMLEDLMKEAATIAMHPPIQIRPDAPEEPSQPPSPSVPAVPQQNSFSAFLALRKLTEPDGRALFRYDTTDQEFSELEVQLRSRLLTDRPSRCAADPVFAQCFVLWAAEWWRRCYDGSNISWTPIFSALGCPADVWTPAERSDCVFRGLKRWKRGLRVKGGFCYILTIALEGGLPLRLLAEGRGGLGRLLNRVMSQAAGAQAGKEVIQGWLESLKEMLPNSYRQPVIFMLLTDIIATVLDLKQEAGLTSGGNVIEILDRHDPKWRERFPLPLKDEHAQGLLAQLFEESVENGRSRQTASPFVLERSLEENERDWRLSASLPLTETLELDALAALFSVEANALPRQAELTLRASEKTRYVTVRRIVGRNQYRLMQQFADILDAAAAQEHTLELMLDEGQTLSAPISQGMELDEELPWAFSVGSGRRFLCQGNGRTREAEALLAVPEAWQEPVATDGGACSPVGEMSFCNRKIWRVRGTLRLADRDGEQFRFVTGSNEGQDGPGFVWKGERLWYGFINPTRAFRGVPRLYTVNAQGIERRVDDEPVFQALRTRQAVQEGPVVGMDSARTPKIRTRMVLLPQNARMEIRGRDAHSGEIRLHHWGVIAANSLSETVRVDFDGNAEAAVLRCATMDNEKAPELVELELFWPHTDTPARLKLPYPARGARVFGMDGGEWRNNARISLNQLLGARMIVAARPNDHISLELRPIHQEAGNSLFHELRPDARSFQLNIQIQRYEEDARRLLAISDDQNASVRLLLIVNGIESFQMNIHRYAGYLVARNDNTQIAPDPLSLRVWGRQTFEAIRLQACNLATESDCIVELGRMSDQGAWDFPPEGRKPGPWLLFPSSDSPVLLSPLLKNIGGLLEAETPLAKAMSLPEEPERMQCLSRIVKSIADDYSDDAWAEVEQWAGQIGHLALQSFDLWRAFSRSASGMAAWAFRLGNTPQTFIRRFAVDLPFSWNVVWFKNWKNALAKLKNQCEQSYGPELCDTVFQSQIELTIRWLTEDCPEIANMLDIAASCFLEEKRRKVDALRGEEGPNAAGALFAGDDCHIQQLLGRHPSTEWPHDPDWLQIICEAQRDPRYKPYLCLEPVPQYMLQVINLPLLLAAQCAVSETRICLNEPNSARSMRECRAFDPEWFENAYNCTVARCLAAGLMDEKG